MPLFGGIRLMRLQTKQKPVSAGIVRQLKEFESYFTTVLRPAGSSISGPALKAIEAGGKRLRPALVMIAAYIGDDVDKEQLKRACAAVELVHLASLVHDDVLDASSTRRGVSTINAECGRRRAVTIGDYLFGLAFDLLAAGNDNGLIEPLAKASVELSSGELRQRRTLRRLDQSVDDYLEKIYAKTAALFVAACTMGSRLAGLGSEYERLLEEYAGSLGMAFQIYDDILDFNGDEKVLGKPVGSDIREGTVTLPMIFALSLDKSGAVGAALVDSTTAAVETAVESVLASGAIDEAKKVARRYVETAQAAAAALPASRSRRDMISLGNFVIDRYH